MKYTLRFLLLGALLYLCSSACLAQGPPYVPFDWYMFAGPVSCNPGCNLRQGPVNTGGLTINVFGECVDQEVPNAYMQVYANNCAVLIELTAYGGSVEQNYFDPDFGFFVMDGARAQAWSQEYYTNFQIWYGYETQWCDGGIEQFIPPENPC